MVGGLAPNSIANAINLTKGLIAIGETQLKTVYDVRRSYCDFYLRVKVCRFSVILSVTGAEDRAKRAVETTEHYGEGASTASDKTTRVE